MPHDLAAQLERWGEDYREALHKLTELHLNPFCLLETKMAAIDELKALSPRLDAIKATVANVTGPLQQQVVDLQAAAAAQESQTEAVASDLTGKVSDIEAALGINQPAAAEPVAEQPLEGQ